MWSEMGVPEFEEGEACDYKNDASIDPDIALSYIDEKLQNVLGHFQKDFEGGVSAENLGAKFGGYGSFLPTYQRSPHPKTPQRAQNYSTQRSPNNFHSEEAVQNSTATLDVPLSLKLGTSSSTMHNPKDVSADVFAKKDSSLLPAKVAEKIPLKQEPSSCKSVNPTDQRTLKVRIKVGSANTRKNAAIYSGLGLISPSSSTGNSPEVSAGMPFESQKTPYESLPNILRAMTLFPVPGGRLISPLSESLLCMPRKENVALDNKPALPLTGRHQHSSMLEDDSAPNMGDRKVSKQKKTKLAAKGEILDELRHGNGMNFEGNTTSPLKKGMEAETLESKQCSSTDLKPKRLSNSICETDYSSKGGIRAPVAYSEAEKDVPVKKREVNKHWMKAGLSTGLVKDVSLESMHGRDGGKFDQQEASSSSMEKIRNHGVSSSHKDALVNTREGGVSSSHKDALVNTREGGKSKGNKIPVPLSVSSDICTSQKDFNARVMDNHKHIVGPKVSLLEHDNTKMPRSSKTPSFDGKKKSNGSQSNCKSAQKDAHKVGGNYEDVLDRRSEQTSDQMNSLERPSGDTAKYYNLEAVKEKGVPNDGPSSTKGVSSGKDLPLVAPVYIEEDWVCCDRCQKWRLLPYGTKPDQLPDNWLCSMLNWLPGMNRCDFSEEETTKALQALYQLPPPESQNNLQSHTDRTAPHGTSADVQHFNQKHRNLISDPMLSRGKQKHKSKQISNTAINCGPVQTSNSTENSRQEVVKSRSLNDMNQTLLETTMMSKSNSQHPSNSCNFPVEKYGDKQKEKLLNGGAFKQKKLKSKRESDQYEYHATKKVRSEAALDSVKYWTSEHGALGRLSLSPSTGLPTRAAPGKDMQKQSEHYYSNDAKLEQKDRLLISVKKQQDVTRVVMDSGSLDLKTGDDKEIYAKKRKLKDWQDSQNCWETLRSSGNHPPHSKDSLKEGKSEGESKKQKKSWVPLMTKEEPRVIRGDRSNKGNTITKILLSGSRDNPVDRNVKKDQQPRKHSEKLTMRDVDSLKKDLGSEQFSIAATSSSSKVSDSRKRASFQEVKGSPIESVSSSPMRTSYLDKLSPTRREGISAKDDAKNFDVTAIGSPRKSMDFEGNFKSNRSGTRRKGEAPGVLYPESHGPVLDFCDSDARHKFGGKAKSSSKSSSEFEINRLVNSEDRTTTIPYRNTVTLQHKSGKGSSSQSKEKDSSGNIFQRVTVKIPDPLREEELNPKKIPRDDPQIDHQQLALHHEDAKHHFSQCIIKSIKDDKSVGKKGSKKWASDSRRENLTKPSDNNGVKAKSADLCSNADGKGTVQQKLIKDFEGEIAKKKDSTQVESRGGKSHVSSRQPMPGTMKFSAFDEHPVDASGDGDVSKVLKQPGIVIDQNGANNSVGNTAPKLCVVKGLCGSSPVKRDVSCQTATSYLKEAEELKDCADRLKNTGFEFECNEAYFQAALKFLHGASLQESCNSGSNKHGEMAQMQIYRSAAKLYETCAHEYEKRQEMVAASLAYKCMEVAYMRVVYCKSSSTNRDRHDLQSSLLMVPQGESPSSSASDVDNLNNQTTLDKAALSKGMDSHTGAHVIVARNRPNFVRLLDFTSDVNSAMEASRKSQNAFAAANIILEEVQNKEGIVSLKRVIDFSFQDVEELIRLVRVASEAISRQGFSGTRD